jgi:hypothetical protein
MKSGPEEAFVGIDITYARDTRLIQQERFELAAVLCQTCSKICAVKQQGIRPQTSNDDRRIIHQPDPAELARIIKTQGQAMIQDQRQACVPFNSSSVRHQEQAAGHTQVNDKETDPVPGTIQGKEQIFAQPPDGGNPTTLQLRWIGNVRML